MPTASIFDTYEGEIALKPLVSILIPAYNAEETITATIESAIAQTWQSKEIIIVDDGSKDRTADVGRRFSSRGVTVVTVPNGGAAAARNHALSLCHGDYIQWLDADDLLSPKKVEVQLEALGNDPNPKILLSGPWAPFYFRTRNARFIQNSLCHSLSPADWLVRKLSENLHMQTATWLTSRALAQAAGPWDTRLLTDDDGEYFCRVLMAAERILFVPEAKVFYRMSPSSRLSHIGSSDKKKTAMVLAMRLHIQYLRSLEDSKRVREASVAYLQNWYHNFYPERPDLVAEMQMMAEQLDGHLETPRLRWKYAWMRPVFGWKAAKWAQDCLPQMKAILIRNCEKMMLRFDAPGRETNGSVGSA